MKDYKDTLNLPQTQFPMKANLSQREPELLKKWQDTSIYVQLRAQRKGKKKFILLDGPPYANGHIHVGHAVNKILKDIVVKSKTLDGLDAPFVPGWDCHGLPIELNVEKKHGKAGRKISAEAFRDACRVYARSQVDIQRDEFIRLGVLGDWPHPYLTMDPHYEANIIRSLAKILRNKHIEKGYKPIHWCLDCSSALAEAEVEYIEKSSLSIDVRFKVVDTVDFLRRIKTEIKAAAKREDKRVPAKVEREKPLPISIPIWTTTPWTLPANQAVALNPYLNYALVECDDHEQLLIAEALLPAVMQRYQIQNYHIVGYATGEDLVGVKLKHPFYDREVPILLGEHVTVDSGTGAVHTAPAHGQEDYAIAKEYHLPIENPVGDDGCYIVGTPIFAGMFVNKVDEKILEVLRAEGALIYQETIRHSYPHCWRHKTPLIFRATPQWFISMDKEGLRKQALQAIDRVEWIPDWAKPRITTMIENRPDWCISRQRTWGVPLAFFIHKETGELHPDTIDLLEKVAKEVDKQGIEAWYQLDPSMLLGSEANQYQKSKDVLDVWFDSGVAHECVLRVNHELAFPADIVLEGSDQHRGWFQSSLLTSVAMNGVEPYKEVLTHGFVVDGQGRKMSKSLGNVIAPEEVIRTLGADILRLWVGSVDYRAEINASKEILNRMSEAYRRIRNTARFLLANLHDFNPEINLLAPEDMLALDRWAVDKTRLIQEEIRAAYATYQFHLAIQKLHYFCITDMGSFYLDIIKDRQYTMAKESRGRRSAQTALFHIVQALVRWMAPIMSFTAEEIWQYIPGKSAESVFLTTWYDALAPLSLDHSMMDQAYWEKIQLVRDAVNKEIENLRNAGKVGSALEAEVYLYCGPKLKKQLDALQDELRFVLITSFAKVIPEHSGPLDVIVTDVPGLALKIEPTSQPKCDRCWHRRQDVGENPDYPGLCGRCVLNVVGNGEVRNYA